jgi:glutathione S-transferase
MAHRSAGYVVSPGGAVQLYVGNRNYSSWSLRPWLVLRELGVPFEEIVLPFGDEAAWAPFRRISPSGKVPCLVDGDLVVWESLAIVEVLAERFPGVWPDDRAARAWARSAASEMHAGFGALRSRCSMSVGVRVRLHEVGPDLQRDVDRLGALFTDGLSRFGGPFLAGPRFTAVDAFFAPVAYRVQTYGLALPAVATDYVLRLLDLPGMRDWTAAALAEPWRDEPHEADVRAVGTWLADLRAAPR